MAHWIIVLVDSDSNKVQDLAFEIADEAKDKVEKVKIINGESKKGRKFLRQERARANKSNKKGRNK